MTSDAAGGVALLEKSSLIQNKNRILIGQGLQRIFTHDVAQRVGVPPINGRRIVIGTLSSLRRKIAANNETFRLMSTERSGPHAMEFWLEKARTGKG